MPASLQFSCPGVSLFLYFLFLSRASSSKTLSAPTLPALAITFLLPVSVIASENRVSSGALGCVCVGVCVTVAQWHPGAKGRSCGQNFVAYSPCVPAPRLV